jgi:hypothetical protein
MAVANTLAYYNTARIEAIKKFYITGPCSFKSFKLFETIGHDSKLIVIKFNRILKVHSGQRLCSEAKNSNFQIDFFIIFFMWNLYYDIFLALFPSIGRSIS